MKAKQFVEYLTNMSVPRGDESESSLNYTNIWVDLVNRGLFEVNINC